MHAILTAPCHTIVTMRSKTEYVINQVNGRTIVEKVGMKPIQKPGIEYEFTTVLELDRTTHRASANKDRTGIIGDQSVEINQHLGNHFLEWLGTKPGATKEKSPSAE